ncbi:MAG: ATP-binding protein [Lysobacterales bacterium]
MPRLFWKLFLALWLSIMAFAIVVSWINQAVILRNAIEEPAAAFEDNLTRIQAKLAADLKAGGERNVKLTLMGLPHGMNSHVFVVDSRGRELLGRERMLHKHKQGRVKVTSTQLVAANGEIYTLVTTGRRPPRKLLAPGAEGIGMRLAVAAVISALVSFLLARYLASPLGQLSRASRLLATGDLSVRVGAPLDQRHDEFGQLALDLDEMAARLQLLQQSSQRLLRDVSHELRSPLARLRVALEIARNKEPVLVADELDRIELESERLEHLVNEVLGLLRESSGAQDLKLSDFDLADLLQDLVGTVNYEIGEGREAIGLQVQRPLVVEADRELLWRVVENVLRNALLHSGDAGGIRVNAKPLDAKQVRISVLDSGPGIDEALISQIFEPFFRVDEARNRDSGGHGLGLAIAASAVRRHGGRISAVNRREGGLEVRVVLPIRQKSGS